MLSHPIVQSVARSVMLTGLLGLSSVANAFDCDVQSPRFLAMGDAYYDVGPTRDERGRTIKAEPITDRSNKLLIALERGNFRRGSGTRQVCSVKNYDAKNHNVKPHDAMVRNSEFKLRDISVDRRSQDFILRAFEDNRKTRTLQSHRLYLPLLEHEISVINDNKLIAHRRQRQRNPQTGFTFFRESEITAIRDDSIITVMQKVWINGEPVGTTTWKLEG